MSGEGARTITARADAAQTVTLVDGDERRTQLIGGGQLHSRIRLPFLRGSRFVFSTFIRAPELDHEGDPPAYMRVG